MNRIPYRLRYYWRRFAHVLGRCPACWERVNYTRHGQAVCPTCGRR